MEGASAHIDDAAFVVVDTETTGLRAGEDRIIEVAAVRLQGGHVVARFQHLVDPQRSIPGAITRLTGIDDRSVQGQPTADVVLPRLIDFMEDSVLVAHNLAFDLRFLDMELHRAGLAPLQGPALCTLRLARRVLHALPSKSLSSLKQHFGIRTPRAHRALDDAEATAVVLYKLIDALRAEGTLYAVSDLLRLQYLPYRSVVPEPRHIPLLKKRLRESLPETPGVYFHKDGAGRILYVGKARNLRQRVLSYFAAIDNHPVRLRRLVREVRDVAWMTTPSELVALLEESRLIKLHRPRFNRAQLEYSRWPLLRVDDEAERPSVSMVFEVRPDGAAYYGPIESRERAADLLRLAGELYGLDGAAPAPAAGPASGTPSGSSGQGLRAFQEFLSGRDPDAADRLRTAMLAAAADRRYEEAAWYRKQLEWVEERSGRGAPLAGSILNTHGVALVAAGQSGSIEAVFVSGGRYRGSLSLPLDAAARDEAGLRRRVIEVFVETPASEERYREAELDEVRLVAVWMHAVARVGAVVFWHPGISPDAFAADILARMDGAGAIGEDEPLGEGPV